MLASRDSLVLIADADSVRRRRLTWDEPDGPQLWKGAKKQFLQRMLARLDG